MNPQQLAALFAGSAFLVVLLIIVFVAIESYLTRRTQRRDELHRITQRIHERREGHAMTNRNSDVSGAGS